MKTQVKTLAGWALTAASLFLLTSCFEDMDVVQRVDEEFAGIQVIEIESGFLEVNYQGIEGMQEVKLIGQLESSRGDRFKIDYTTEGDRLRIELDQKSGFGTGRNRGYLYLTGPKNMKLQIKGGSGEIKVLGIDHPVLEVSIGSGKIELADILSSEIHTEVGSGSFSANSIAGNLQGSACSGELKIQNMEGNVELVASSGKIDLSNIEGSVNAEMSSGRVHMDGVQELQTIKISSGTVDAQRVGLGPKTYLSGSSGNFRIQTFSDLNAFNFDLKAGSGKVEVGNRGSSGSLLIDHGSPYTVFGQVSSGNIEIKN
ncbi:hypothetical protein Aoki45_08810 [Algoriphagus sp. oki45]|uniref:DUF4097 family beta strand repeat-containing protein n=1 Tax=Algoriphagus sp. oki45 TaxID=3067294 RepID=UPI0027E6FDE0|nr:hypothetical protein Aoki45_08810 [Algoriphagus sp. oki45]